MAVEIERKFLLATAAWRDSIARSERLVQGYLTRADERHGHPPCSVRVRIGGDAAWLNIKSAGGLSRPSMASEALGLLPGGLSRPSVVSAALGLLPGGLSRPSVASEALGLLPGVERREFEYVIPRADAEQMLAEFCTDVVEKIRHDVPHAGMTFEIDEFLGANAGLVVAELELPSADAKFDRPAWLGKEVSDKLRYYNLNLLQHPYSCWSESERAGN